MRNNINVCVVAGTHGDEYELGVKVQELLSGQVYKLVGNPRAVDLGRRFVDSDLNRAFSGKGKGYEAERAEEIRQLFDTEGFTHVIDIHTSPTTESIVPIIPDECASEATNRVVNSIPIADQIVHLPKENPASSLVGAFGSGGIGLECPRNDAIKLTAQVITGGLNAFLLQGRKHPGAVLRSHFRAYGHIPEDLDLPAGGIRDFEVVPRIGGLAFVAAPEIYKDLGYGHQGTRVFPEGRTRI